MTNVREAGPVNTAEQVLARIMAENETARLKREVRWLLNPVDRPRRYRGDCQAPDVVTGTGCLVNTNGRCTWCGRRMGTPGPAPRTGLWTQDPRLFEYGGYDA